jgi:dTDP-4-dehydrorhamnose 3,5-epimerase
MIENCQVFDLNVHHDNRGFFTELYNQNRHIITAKQINQSYSKKGTIRGIHAAPFWKLVTCVKGKIFDVCVDLRSQSKTFLKYQCVELSEDNNKQFFIPNYCGHGFLALEDSIVIYTQGDTYNPITEISFRYDEPSFEIPWPKMEEYIVSEKDLKAPVFSVEKAYKI